MKKRVSVLFLSFLLVVSLLQCYAAAEKQTSLEENGNVVREIEYGKSQQAVLIPSYFGGSSDDTVTAIVLEGTHIAYIAGYTVSDDITMVNGYQEQNAGSTDGFVIKMNVTSNTIIYSTYVGGNSTDHLNDIAVDSAGNVYGTGTTTSHDYPVVNPYQQDRSNPEYVDADGFVFKLSATGDELLYSTYFGWWLDDHVYSIDIDNLGNAYIVGVAGGGSISTFNAFDNTSVMYEGFLAKFNSTGNGLEYLTNVGGSGDDTDLTLAVDDSGNAYVAGWTDSDDFPELNGYDESYNGQIDCFVVKVNTTGTGTFYSTYVGGSGIDKVSKITIDDSGCVYGTGVTSSSDLPTVNAYDDSLDGMMDCFVFKLSQDGESLLYSSYIGGSGNDYGVGVAGDPAGAVYMTGYTDSDDYPLMNARDSTFGGPTECIVSKLNITTSALDYSTYLGGSGDDSGMDVAVNSNGDIIVVGDTDSVDFPGIEGSLNGDTDCFVIVISEEPSGPPIDWILLLLIGVGVAAVVVIAAVVCVKRR